MLIVLLACTAPTPADTATAVDTARGDGEPMDTSVRDTAGVGAGRAPLPLEVVSLGVGGVSLRHGDTLVLTAPMYTNPGLVEVTLGDVVSDPDVVDHYLAAEEVAGAGAILVGHAHYDHLLDVPRVRELAGEQARVYANLSAANLLPELDVVVVNDATDPLVDRRMCAEADPCTGLPAGLAGTWIEGEGFRLRALCSTHPAQFLGIVHFGEGCVEAPQESPPTAAGDWLEGATVAWLIDFLDDEGEVAHRVYYQDAPTNAPEGLVHPDVLADRSVDLALLNVGSFDAVRDHPTQALANLAPAYALGLHWENFFQTQDAGIEPIPFHADPAEFDAAAEAALGEDRYWRPEPGDRYEFEP